MNPLTRTTDKADSSYLDDDDDDTIGKNMILQGVLKIPISITSTEIPSGKPEVTLALIIVLVILIIILIISIFLLLYCVLKRQEGERRKRENYEQKLRKKMRSKTMVTDLARRAKVSQIAASIEAAVKSTESALKVPEQPPKQLQSSTVVPAESPRRKTIPKKLPQVKHTETSVEAPSLFINQIFVNRWHNLWQQVDHEPSDFSYELESDSINDNICLEPL